jgi:crossover junction endodeoxyribonuclease RuvC
VNPPPLRRAARILGIDTSLRSTGVGVVAEEGSRHRAVFLGTIRNPATRPLSACLAHLHAEIGRLLVETQPDAVAIEAIFFCRNVRTALLLGQARGAVIAACAAAGCPVHEYEPRRVKLAVAAHGNASKEQIQKMVATLLGLPEEPPEDAADALALALCHLHNRNRLALRQDPPI